MDAAQRHQANRLNAWDLPTTPGVVVWYHDGEPCWVGVARGASGLRGRVLADQSRGMNLKPSQFRIAVAVAHAGIDEDAARGGPSAVTPAQVGVVNRWIEAAAVAWVECATVKNANALERALLGEWVPELNRG